MFTKTPKKLSLFISIVFLVSTMLIGTAYAIPPTETIEFTAWVNCNTSYDTYCGQSFTPANNIAVTGVRLRLTGTGYMTTTNVRVAIRTAINDDTTQIESNITQVSVKPYPPEWEWDEFSFPTPVNLIAGTTYYFVISETDRPLGYRYIADWANPYAGGQLLTGTGYTNYTAVGGELNFQILNTIITNNPPVADANGPYTADEGTAISFDGSGSTDLDADELQYRWDFDNDGTFDTSFSTDATAAHTWNDDYTGTVTLEVFDGTATDTDSTTVTVNNVVPTVGLITAPTSPVAVGTAITASASFTDPGTLDTHTAGWSWGDGGTSPGTVDEGTVDGGHTYTAPGIYTVVLTVTDDDGGQGTSTFEYVVVYDPNGGFVTGGGWIMSPVGAYAADPCLSGKANFGFVSKYQKGATIPTGHTEFQFKAGDLNFKSTSYQWLVIAGARAQYKGVGTINGSGEYGFMLTAIDGQINGGGGIDKFRIKIWEIGGDTVYDNQMGSDDTANITTILGGGSIVIHN
jgi:hypothetical protein